MADETRPSFFEELRALINCYSLRDVPGMGHYRPRERDALPVVRACRGEMRFSCRFGLHAWMLWSDTTTITQSDGTPAVAQARQCSHCRKMEYKLVSLWR